MRDPHRLSIHRLILLFAITIISQAMFQACDKDDIIGPRFSNVYFLTNNEPGKQNEEYLIIDGQDQELTLSVVRTAYNVISFPSSLSPSVMIKDNSNPESFKIYHYDSDILSNENFIPGTGIKLAVIEENGNPAMRFTFPENNTSSEITLGILYHGGEYNKKLNAYLEGNIIITQNPLASSESIIAKARYKSKIYESEVTINEKGDIEYLNPEYNQLMCKLDEANIVHAVIIDSNCMSYYDEADIEDNRLYQDILNLNISDNSSITRATGFENHTDSDLGYFAIFDNDHFKGTSLIKGLSDFHFTYNIPSLKPYNLNDKVTSIAIGYYGADPIVCSVLTIWDDSDYNHGDNKRSKHRISLIASQKSRQVSIPDLKQYKKIGSSKSWNDCISSISCHFGYIDRQLLNY